MSNGPHFLMVHLVYTLISEMLVSISYGEVIMKVDPFTGYPSKRYPSLNN